MEKSQIANPKSQIGDLKKESSVLPGCRLCGSRDLKLYYTQGSSDQYRFYRCASCKLVNYDLSTGLSQEKYAEVYVDPRREDQRHNTRQTETYGFLKRHIERPGRLLDVGCGNGRLLFLAQRDGWRVKGLELSDSLADSTRKTVDVDVEVCDLLDYEVREGEVFDVVVLRHVLEHIPDPILAMRKIFLLLGDDGSAVLEFPNIEGLEAKFKRVLRRTGFYGKEYSQDYKPGHCNEFCRHSFEFLSAKTGFALQIWYTFSSKPMLSFIHRVCGTGGKARVLIRKM